MKATTVVSLAALLLTVSCSAQSLPAVQPTAQPSVVPTAQATVAPTAKSATDQPWSENWLLGTWAATFPSAGAKLQLVVNSVKLVNETKAEGSTNRTYAYSGTSVWNSNLEMAFKSEDWNGDTSASNLLWVSRSQPGGKYVELIIIKLRGNIYADFTTEPQQAKAGTAPDSFMLSGSYGTPDQAAESGGTKIDTRSGLLKFTKIK